MRVKLGRTYKTVLAERRRVAEKTLEVSLERPDGFMFQPGQYVQLGLPKLVHSDWKGRSRVLSLASSPAEEERLRVAFRETGSGYKRTLSELPIGSPLLVQGPHGFRTLPVSPSRPRVLVAGGIGITAYLSVLRFVAESNEPQDAAITLLYANRTKATAAYLDELTAIVRRHDNISVSTKFGALDEKFVRSRVKDAHGCIWHLAGPPPMVDSIRNLLFLRGVDPRRVCFEEFVGYW